MMLFRFPIKDVEIHLVGAKKVIDSLGYSNHNMSLNQHEFLLDLERVAYFYVCNGNRIEIMPYAEATQNVLELYLNGSIYGAVLHQRKILPLHGSCFSYQGAGIMICGESGVGKSSLTAAFCLNGADFLTDDVTPVVFKAGKPHIWAISDRIKLWSDSLQQLDQEEEELIRIVPEWGKFYFPMESDKGEFFTLDHLFILEVHDKPSVSHWCLEGVEKFAALRNEIYRWEYLKGMPESEASYLKQLIAISQTVKVTKVARPANIPIEQLRIELEKLTSNIVTQKNLLIQMSVSPCL